MNELTFQATKFPPYQGGRRFTSFPENHVQPSARDNLYPPMRSYSSPGHLPMLSWDYTNGNEFTESQSPGGGSSSSVSPSGTKCPVCMESHADTKRRGDNIIYFYFISIVRQSRQYSGQRGDTCEDKWSNKMDQRTNNILLKIKTLNNK